MSHGLARCCGGAQPRWPYRRPAAGRPGTVLSPLVGLLAPSGPAGLQWEAAAALWDLCIGNTLTQDSVRECGGIAALVALLAPGRSAGMQRLAAGALATICSFNMRNMDSVRVCGGVAALVGLLAPGVAPDHVRARAALTLGNFCLENAQNQDSVRACGGVAALVALLAPGGSANVPELAARALDMCIGNTRNQDSVRECGGGAALVALLAPGCSARVRKRVVSALANLCVQSVKVQDCVRECGGVGARASHQWKHAEPGCSQGMRGGVQPWSACLHAPAPLWRASWRRMRCTTWRAIRRVLASETSQRESEAILRSGRGGGAAGSDSYQHCMSCAAWRSVLETLGWGVRVLESAVMRCRQGLCQSARCGRARQACRKPNLL